MNELLIYAAVISLLTAAVTVYDKAAAKAGSRRIPEKTLFLLAFLGGATAEYIVMQAIRHKTKHKSFMIGLPLMILLHVALIVAFILFV